MSKDYTVAENIYLINIQHYSIVQGKYMLPVYNLPDIEYQSSYTKYDTYLTGKESQDSSCSCIIF